MEHIHQILVFWLYTEMFKDQIICLNEKTEKNEIEINENKLFEKIYNMLDNENNDENVIYILYQKM